MKKCFLALRLFAIACSIPILLGIVDLIDLSFEYVRVYYGIAVIGIIVAGLEVVIYYKSEGT